MGLKRRLRQLQKAAQGRLDVIELEDGGRHWFAPEASSITLFVFWSASLRAVHHGTPRPEPPEILQVVARAKDRGKALLSVYPTEEGVALWCPLDVETLVERGELVERPLVVDRLDEAEVHLAHLLPEPGDEPQTWRPS